MRPRGQRGAALLCAAALASACVSNWADGGAADPRRAALARWRQGGAAALGAWSREEPAQAWSAFDRLLRDVLEPPGGSVRTESEVVAGALARGWRDAGERRPQRWLVATAALAEAERAKRRTLWRRLDRAVGAAAGARLEALRAESRAAGDRRLELTALRHLAQQAYHQDDIEALRRWLAAGQPLLEGHATPMQRADFLRYAGWLRFFEDDLRGALNQAQQALRIDRAIRNHASLVGDLYAAASFCDELGLLEQAASHLASMHRLALQVGHATGAMAALADQSLIYRRIGDLERARALLRQARAQSGALRADRNRSILLARLAYLEVEAGRWERARSWLLAAWHLERRARRAGELATLEARLALVAAELGEAHTSRRFQAWALEHMKACPTPSDRAAVLLELARARTRLGHAPQARALLRQAERHLVSDPAPLLAREILFRRGEAALACADLDAAEAAFSRAATWAESSWQLAGRGDLRVGVLATVQEIYAAWIERLAARRRAEQALIVAERGRARSLLERLGRRYSERAGFPISTLKELTERLRQGELLLVFRCDPQITWRWAVSARGLTLHRIAIPTSRWAELVQSAENGRRSDRERLSELLLARLAPQLDAADRLIVVADGPLLRLPFAALPAGDRLLIERFTLSHAPSASAWVRWSEAGAPRRRAPVLVVGDPLGDLPGARSEARAVARRFDGSRLLLGSQATPAAVLAALSAAGLAHVAAHYRLELSNPYQSELLLARADGRGPAPLSMARLSRSALPLRPLIVLSSCSAAGGRFHPGEGVVGGFRALFEAGASGVIAPLEPVADLSTARLMRDLAAELEAGHPPDLALARAQRAALARGGGRSRPDWARFIFIGGAA